MVATTLSIRRIRTRHRRTTAVPVYQPPPYQPQQDHSPPPSVKALEKQARGPKAAHAIPGQEPSAMAARAQQIDGLECELDERERKFRKYQMAGGRLVTCKCHMHADLSNLAWTLDLTRHLYVYII